ncbi:hypothetical protein FEM48_Zijuj09G0130900 [Ziziphus jujuba var. spinosa]|uniref:Pentatricopeptide repeat-containing protein n=1 Tax=Ziziphus jujuba var. spinosa TaxID=714518 RepID=A0A978UT64_ZIZJJ|nr:hypothetical protein FEM48_Zijuj09G0130900 [Ziziphus jujuba var. spinosa]
MHTFLTNPSPRKSTELSALLQARLPPSQVLQIHAQIFQAGAHQDNLITTRLIGHYRSVVALRVFHQLQTPNIFPFNAIIRVLAEEGNTSLAFSLFRNLKRLSLSPNDFTFSFLLKACFRSNDAGCVKQVHSHVVKVGFLDDSFVCSGLLMVYAKGLKDMASAHRVFDEMIDRSMVSCWTSLIAGYAQLGEIEEVLRLFIKMVNKNLQPTDDTLVSVLSACSNLEIIKIENWVTILLELIDNLDLQNLVQVDPESSSGYVMFANALAFDHRWADVTMLRWIMKEKGVVKQPGCSWISIDGVVHEFLVGCPSNPQIESICQTLKGLTMQMKAISPQRTCY